MAESLPPEDTFTNVDDGMDITLSNQDIIPPSDISQNNSKRARSPDILKPKDLKKSIKFGPVFPLKLPMTARISLVLILSQVEAVVK